MVRVETMDNGKVSLLSRKRYVGSTANVNNPNSLPRASTHPLLFSTETVTTHPLLLFQATLSLRATGTTTIDCYIDLSHIQNLKPSKHLYDSVRLMYCGMYIDHVLRDGEIYELLALNRVLRM